MQSLLSLRTKLEHAQVIYGTGVKLRDIKPGEMAFQCPECKEVYYVKGGHQRDCHKYKYIRNGQLAKANGCGFSGIFNVVGYNFLRTWENNTWKCTSRQIAKSPNKGR